MFSRLAALCVFLTFVFPAHNDWTAQVWQDFGLTVTYPTGWQINLPETGLLILSNGAETTIRVRVSEGGDLSDLLNGELGALDLLHFGFQAATLYGRGAWTAQAVSRDGAFTGAGYAGSLPDDRLIVVAGRWRGDSTILADVLAGISTTDAIFPTFQPVWTLADHVFQRVIAGAGSTVYALDASTGIAAVNGATGALIAEYAFENPTQPTDIAVDGAGVVYVADIVCRCLLRLSNGMWIDPLGAFAGNAPLGVAVAPDGAIYAIDRAKDGNFALHLVGQADLIPLNFNAIAPPSVTVNADGDPLVTEWLSSLMDGSINAYVSVAGGLSGRWMSLSPSDVTDDGQGGMVIAGSTITHVHPYGDGETILASGGQSAALAGDRLYIISDEGILTGYRRQFSAVRGGSPDRLQASGAAYGELSEDAPLQTWTYAGTAGETITVNAIDAARIDPYQVGLDMALRVTAPDGSEIAYNDDQRGQDLYGAYDSQVADVILPADGVYTFAVEWVQGSGAYLIGARSDQRAAVGADGVIRMRGRLIDATPVERWIVDGNAGEVITLTMITQSGDLDPALELLNVDGSRLAYNDDTPDPVLGVNAQIYRVRLPSTGAYVVEASRFDGSGRYELVIVRVE